MAQEEELTRYVLGRLGDDEIERVEREIFDDDARFEQLLAVEDDLVDAYSSGRLEGDDRVRFERYVLQTREDRERVAFASALATLVAADAPRRAGGPDRIRAPARFPVGRTVWIALPLAASLLLAAGAVWLTLETSRLDDELERAHAEQRSREARERELDEQLAEERRRREELDRQMADERQRARELEAELERERAAAARARRPSAQAAPSGILALALRPGGLRDGGGVTTLSIPAGARQVRLAAVLPPGEHARYRAELQTVGGEVVWSLSGLEAQRHGGGRRVSVAVPAAVFGAGDHILVLVGTAPSGEEESAGEYFFRVTRGQYNGPPR